MGHATIDEDEVVRAKCLGRAGDVEREAAFEHIESLLEGVQMPVDAPSTRSKLGDDHLLMHRAGRPADQVRRVWPWL